MICIMILHDWYLMKCPTFVLIKCCNRVAFHTKNIGKEEQPNRLRQKLFKKKQFGITSRRWVHWLVDAVSWKRHFINVIFQHLKDLVMKMARARKRKSAICLSSMTMWKEHFINPWQWFTSSSLRSGK